MAKRLLIFLTISLAFSSCYIYKGHTLSLEDVKKNDNTPVGNIKTITIKEDPVYTFDEKDYECVYTDDNIKVVWFGGLTRLYFSLTNLSDELIKLNWDNITFVNTKGVADRVVHDGVKYAEVEKSQSHIIIPKGAIVEDFLLPAKSSSFAQITQRFGSWVEKLIIPADEGAKDFFGKKLRVSMPLLIGKKEVNYIFTFEVRDFLDVKPDDEDIQEEMEQKIYDKSVRNNTK